MRCLRIYATPDGESHFREVDIAMTMKPAFPNERRLKFLVTTQQHASVFPTSPPGYAKWAFTSHRIDSSPFGWMATWNLKRAMERRDAFRREKLFSSRILTGKEHISRHPEEGQNAIIVILPSGLDAPLD